MDDWLDDLTRLLFDSSFMALATADADGVPWATPVEFACDDDLRFYWTSHVDARHSRNVRANPRVGAVIFDSRQIAGVHAEVQGLYIEGSVEEFRDDELEAVRPSLSRWLEWRGDRREPPREASTSEPPDAESPWRQYRLTPVQLYALDPAGHPDIPGVRVWRLPVDLAESFARAYREKLD